MVKCRTSSDVPVMGMGVQPKNNKIYLSVTDPIQGCVTIPTDTYKSVTSTLGDVAVNFHKYDKPTDQLNCPEPLCITTGTLFFNFLATTGGTPTYSPTKLVFHDYESTAYFMNGVITYYLKFEDAGNFTVKTKVGDGTNSIEFNDVLTLDGATTLLIQHAMDEALGLLPNTDNGVTIEIEITPSDTSSGAQKVGISSIALATDKSDFEQNEVIVLTCIDEVDLPSEVDLSDLTCLGQFPDPESVTPELSITAQQVTGNYWKLNPLLHKLDNISSFVIESMTKTIATVSVNGTDYQGIRLLNYYADECSFVSAYLPTCEAVEGRLRYNSISNAVEPDLDTFKILTDKLSGDTFMVFNNENANMVATITFPVEKRSTTLEANTDFVDGRRVRVVVPFKFKNGYNGYYLSESAFVTSFPFGWSSTDTTPLEFTIAFKYENNHFYRIVLFED